MANIGVVGAGVAGLHLGLLLRQHDIPVTIYTDRSAEAVASGRLPNTVAHHAPTVEREKALGVHFWPVEEYGYHGHNHYFGGPQPVAFRGDFTRRSNAIDYRLYLPKLMDAFEERGGQLRVGNLRTADLERLSATHDLIVIAAGRGAFGGLFPRRPEKSPYDKPQRILCVALYHGVAPTEPKDVSINVSPHGELLELPIFSFEGHVTALLFECVPDGDLVALTELNYDDSPAAFEKAVLEKIEAHFPPTLGRIDPGQFRVTRPQDVLQGAIVPSVREDYTVLPDGTYALAVGDVHTVVDPVIGQGANSASHSAAVVAEAIVEDLGFDELFCQRVAHRREDVTLGASDWTNLMLRLPPPPQLLRLVVAMAQDKAICDEFTDNFGYPDRQWRILATPARTRAYLARRHRDDDDD